MTDPLKRRRRKEARPGEIIAAGLAEFAEKGFAATRLEDVGTRAGVSKGTIYLYFPSKEALFEAAVRERLVTLMEGLAEEATAHDGPVEDLLRHLLEAIYARLVGGDAGVLLKVLIAEGQRFPKLVELYRTMALSRGMALIRSILARGIAKGEIRDAPAASDPRLVIAPAIVAAIFTQVFARGAPLDRDAFLEAHLDLVLNGLRPR
jgi:AcrR family transcriptional regulator